MIFKQTEFNNQNNLKMKNLSLAVAALICVRATKLESLANTKQKYELEPLSMGSSLGSSYQMAEPLSYGLGGYSGLGGYGGMSYEPMTMEYEPITMDYGYEPY